jgi:chromosome partitioning protein
MEQRAVSVDSKVVTSGYLQDFGAIAVLQALSLSRQYTAVTLFSADGEVAGRVTLKSGMVLDASVSGSRLQGAAAFSELVSRPLHAFQVERLTPLSVYPTPIGRLSTHLLAAQASNDQSKEPDSARLEEALQNHAQPASGKVPSKGLSQVNTGPLAPIVGIASPKGGCGKTTVALNLAVALANSGLKVTLVDADPNGDILSAIGSRERARAGGVFDALHGGVPAHNFELATVIERLRLIPAMGERVASGLADTTLDGTHWRSVLAELRTGSDLVLIDLPAGMFGISAQILDACSHVLGVLQAETIPKRSFSMFQQGLAARGSVHPKVIGVILNMFRRSHSASLSVLVDAGVDLPPSWLFETTIPRNDVFLDASEEGMPISLAEGASASFISLLFDTLASEVRERLELGKVGKAKRASSFLL